MFEALRAGASGFMLKDTLPPELLAAIRVVAAGDALLAPKVTRRLIEQFATAGAAPGVTPGAAPGDNGPDQTAASAPHPGIADLTAHEREILVAVAAGLSNAEIADTMFISHATAKTHVSRLLMKLDARDRAQLVMIAYESGVIIPGAS